mgnify:FL=1
MARIGKYGGIKGSTLKVSVSETIAIGGRDYGASNSIEIHEITDISRRIVTIPGGVAAKELLAFGAAIAAGTYIASDVKYIRITNLDDSNECHLIFKNSDNDETAIVLDKGQSFIYNGKLNQNEGVVDTMEVAAAGAVTVSSGGVTGLNDLTEIRGCTTASEVDVELYVASV